MAGVEEVSSVVEMSKEERKCSFGRFRTRGPYVPSVSDADEPDQSTSACPPELSTSPEQESSKLASSSDTGPTKSKKKRRRKKKGKGAGAEAVAKESEEKEDNGEGFGAETEKNEKKEENMLCIAARYGLDASDDE